MEKFKIPDFYAEEYEDTREKILKSTTPDSLNFLFMTDMHLDFPGMRDPVIRQCRTMVGLAKETRIDFILLGGDIIHGIIDKDIYFGIFREYAEIFGEAGVPVLPVRGNHDDNAYHNRNKPDSIPGFSWEHIPTDCIISASEWSERVISPLAGEKAVKDPEKADSSYYYADFPDKKTRVVVLDSYDYTVEENERGYARYSAETWDRLSDRQMKWFAEVALDPKKDGWNFIVATHNHLTMSGYTKPFRNSRDVCDALAAFNHREKYESERYGVNVDYSENTSRATLSIFGHTHRDLYDFDERTGLILLGSGNAKPQEYDCTDALYKYDFARLERKPLTASEALFDCVISTPGGKYEKIRFGAGADRTFG